MGSLSDSELQIIDNLKELNIAFEILENSHAYTPKFTWWPTKEKNIES